MSAHLPTLSWAACCCTSSVSTSSIKGKQVTMGNGEAKAKMKIAEKGACDKSRVKWVEQKLRSGQYVSGRA